MNPMQLIDMLLLFTLVQVVHGFTCSHCNSLSTSRIGTKIIKTGQIILAAGEVEHDNEKDEIEGMAEEMFNKILEETEGYPNEISNTESNDEDNERIEAIDSQQILTSLLRIASSSDRGQFASVKEKKKCLDLIETLETNTQKEACPTLSPNVKGTWELLYSDTQLFRSSPFFMAGRAVCSTPEQAKQYDWFCDMHRSALAISTIGKVRQIISSVEGRMISEFEVKVGSVPFLNDFTPFSYSGGLPVTIDGAIVSSADITSLSDGNAWEIYMDTVEIKGSNIPFFRNALDNSVKLQSRELASVLEQNIRAYSTPKPVFKTTYLNDDIRISRDQDGKVFVYSKISDDVTPTDYSNEKADLGIKNLIEGFKDSILSL